jgi:hypothetical protein
MSDVLLQFAAPLFHDASDNSTYKYALEFSIIIWNMSLLPLEGQADQMQRLLIEYPETEWDETKSIINMLLDRKAYLFRENRRVIVDFRISNVGGKRHFTVASTEMK